MPSALIIGNSSGIGLALTRLLLGQGWTVAGISRSESDIAQTEYEPHVVDVCAPDFESRLARIVSEYCEKRGPLDVCVYCTGIGQLVDVQSLDGERRVFETNLLGAVSSARILIPRMAQAGSGHFIGLSSQADRWISAESPSYSASKAALSSYLEGLADAYRPHGVFVTNIRFGFVDTKMVKAKQRPFMITSAAAAEQIDDCLRRRPVRHTISEAHGDTVVVSRAGRECQALVDLAPGLARGIREAWLPSSAIETQSAEHGQRRQDRHDKVVNGGQQQRRGKRGMLAQVEHFSNQRNQHRR